MSMSWLDTLFRVIVFVFLPYQLDGRSNSVLTTHIKSHLKCRIDQLLLSSFALHLCETGLHTTFQVSNW